MNLKPLFNPLRIPDPGKRLVLLLLLTTIFASGLVVLRVYLTFHLTYVFLLWNLFLAWIPFIISRYMIYSDTSQRKWYLNLLQFSVWLLFFPNAPYILTDLVHLKQRIDMPYWYDMMIFLFFCFNSVFLAIASMIHMKRVINKFFRNSISHIIILMIFAMTSLGVYIGRFERYNSWDVFTDPINLFRDVFGLILNAGDNLRFLYMFISLSFLLIINYFTVLYLILEMNQKESSNETTANNN